MHRIVLRQTAARVPIAGLQKGTALPPWEWATPYPCPPPQWTRKPSVLQGFSTTAAVGRVRRPDLGNAGDGQGQVGSQEREEDLRRVGEDDAHDQSRPADLQKPDESRGRLLTTPSRLLKMILPLPSCPGQEYVNPGKSVGLNTVRRKDEPIALLVHPQQPLSYLERLIQAELPPLRSDGYLRPPKIWFRAEADEEQPGDRGQGGANGKNVASYSGLGRKGPRRRDVRLVRWSGSTEVGDFIRDAARGREFHVDIEGHEEAARVSVPSFGDRTYYMRMRLRKMSRQIDDMSRVKNECDLLAHRSARHLAHGGFLGLAGWWGVVYYVTFHTEMGWDLVEPVTYLAGLAAIMGGYLWFLYMSRDLSYKAAMNVTVSRRQSALYQERGFDYGAWESLAQEANMLRREIRHIAAEYDVEWDELKDLGRKEVKVALESEEKDEDDSEDERGRKRNDSKQKESKPLLDKGDK